MRNRTSARGEVNSEDELHEDLVQQELQPADVAAEDTMG